MRQLNLGPAQLRALTPESAKENRTVYDAEHGGSLPGCAGAERVTPASTDVAVNQAYDNAGITYGFYRDVFKRDSLDGTVLGLVSTVHYSSNYDNAFWQGTQMSTATAAAGFWPRQPDRGALRDRARDDPRRRAAHGEPGVPTSSPARSTSRWPTCSARW